MTTTVPSLDLRAYWEESVSIPGQTGFRCDLPDLGFFAELEISGEVDFVTVRSVYERSEALRAIDLLSGVVFEPPCVDTRDLYLERAFTGLGFSAAVMDRIAMTRPVDGTQVAETNEYVATWTADGEGGFTLVVERLP